MADPTPATGEVLIRVSCFGCELYRRLLSRRKNTRLLYPFVLGAEGSGVIEGLGEGVTDFAVGDEVAWYGPLGTYAELVVVKTNIVSQGPEGGHSLDTADGNHDAGNYRALLGSLHISA